MSEASRERPNWPADIIHVNEDGWVLVNRGRQHGVSVGLRLLVVGQGIRDLRDLFVAAEGDTQPIALRIRRTYEQLEVVHVEANCAVAIATRTPAARRPSFYRGPEGELLVWVPLPEGFTWPRPGADADEEPMEGEASDDTQDTQDAQGASGQDEQAGDGSDESGEMGDGGAETAETEAPVVDHPPERGEQDDERWEEALPLNGVNVGDIVVPAMPITGSPTATSGGSATVTGAQGNPAGGANPFEAGRDYDWMNSQQQS